MNDNTKLDHNLKLKLLEAFIFASSEPVKFNLLKQFEDNEDKFLSPLYSNVAISKLHLFTNPHGIELAVDRALAALKACASCDVVLENISQQLASSICATLHLMTTLFRLREPLELY